VEEEVLKDHLKAGLLVSDELPMYGRYPNVVSKSRKKKKSSRSPRSPKSAK